MIDNLALKAGKEGGKVISVLSCIIKYLIMALCCLSVTFLFTVYAIGMILIFVYYKGVIFMNLLLNIIVVVFVGLIIDYSYNNLRNENKILRKDIDELQYKLLTYENGGIFEECDKRLKEFNEIMFGSPPLKNKVVIVRSIKDYDYSAYRKDIDALNEYLNNGWSIVNHESSEFVHTYILGKPLSWCKEGDNNDE